MSSATVSLSFKWPVGQGTFYLSEEEALKVAVALRSLGLGLSYKKTQPMVTCATDKFAAAEHIIHKIRSAAARR
jgi:hypothetical protein